MLIRFDIGLEDLAFTMDLLSAMAQYKAADTEDLDGRCALEAAVALLQRRMTGEGREHAFADSGCDIRGHRRANGRKATGSRLTDAVTSTTAPAEFRPPRDPAGGANGQAYVTAVHAQEGLSGLCGDKGYHRADPPLNAILICGLSGLEGRKKNGPHLRGPGSGGARTGGQSPASPALPRFVVACR